MSRYKGYTIVAQFQQYSLWEIDEDGNRTRNLIDYDDEFDCYMIVGEDNHHHPDFEDQFFDSLMEAKLAIDKHLETT